LSCRTPAFSCVRHRTDWRAHLEYASQTSPTGQLVETRERRAGFRHRILMTPRDSDAFVFFGATGDLAYKKIFPALQALIRRGDLNIPVVGMARANWTLDRLRERARESLEHNGGVDRDAFASLCRQLRYVGGDYNDPATYARLKEALSG